MSELARSTSCHQSLYRSSRLPTSLMLSASRAAIAENPDNAPALPRGALLPGAFIDSPVALAALTGKLWKPGRTLRVRFLDGDPAVQKRIEPLAQEWCKVADLKFVFGDDPNAEIRISFVSRVPGPTSAPMR